MVAAVTRRLSSVGAGSAAPCAEKCGQRASLKSSRGQLTEHRRRWSRLVSVTGQRVGATCIATGSERVRLSVHAPTWRTGRTADGLSMRGTSAQPEHPRPVASLGVRGRAQPARCLAATRSDSGASRGKARARRSGRPQPQSDHSDSDRRHGRSRESRRQRRRPDRTASGVLAMQAALVARRALCPICPSPGRPEP